MTFAWPIDLVANDDGMVVGFVTPKLDLAAMAPLPTVSHPRDRNALALDATWRDLLRVARNLASLMRAVHEQSYVIGDLDDRNVLVAAHGSVTLLNCDMMQVPNPTGYSFRCLTSRAEYTPRELHGADLASMDRTDAHDSFALAVLIYMVLMEGQHPFGGLWQGQGEPPDIARGYSSVSGFTARTCP